MPSTTTITRSKARYHIEKKSCGYQTDLHLANCMSAAVVKLPSKVKTIRFRYYVQPGQEDNEHSFFKWSKWYDVKG